MKISIIILLFTVIVIVKGWVTLLQPIALGLGAVLMGLNIDTDLLTDIKPASFKN